jgi:N-acetyl sugar amidotransferase
MVFSGEEGERLLTEIVSKVKENGRNRQYDSIIGLSGGTDSSFTAYHAKRLGLRPLAVHFDNGWNTEISAKNVENIVKKLDFDLYNYAVDWQEFRDVQLSFLKSSVIDIEMFTDNAVQALIFNLAREKRIKYILTGGNFVTETIMPKAWTYAKWDGRNIKGIHRKISKKQIEKVPVYGLLDKIKARFRFQHIKILNYLDYKTEKAIEILKDELGWQYYGGKHYESIFTKFYQCYILPTKFNIDKRKAHLSTLICSGQMTREKALEEMKKPIYSPDEFQKEKEFVLQKLGLSEQEFSEIMNLPIKSHQDYPNSLRFNNLLLNIKRLI